MKRTSRPRRNPGTSSGPVERRVVVSEKPLKRFRPVPVFEQPHGFSTEKPVGLWYSCGDEWERWMRQGQTLEQVNTLARARHRYELKLDTSSMLLIRTPEEFDAFERQYGSDGGIDWWSVVRDYSGIEVCPYRSDRAARPEESHRRGSMVGRRIIAGHWYDLWDVASGVVWRSGTVKKIVPVGEFQKNRRTSRPRRNPELLKKGTRLTGSFADDGTGWRYSGEYPSVRGQRWVASLGLSRGELSVEGATEYDPGFRSSLVQMAAEYPELLDLDARFDGPRVPVAALVQSGVPTIDRTSWLHGTSSAVLDSVMASGLRPRWETGAAAVFVGAAKESRPQYVYLTTQRNMARAAARAAARASGGVPVVLRVEPLPVGRMQPDEDSGMETAEESLWRSGSVAYEGSVAPSKIAVDEVLKDGEWSAPVSGNRRTSRRPKRTSRRSR